MSGFAVRVPASTSNLGAGFDALSLALRLHLRVRGQPADQTSIAAGGRDSDRIPLDDTNLLLRVARHVAARRGQALPSARLVIDNDIPLARGLGSSAAAIVAGVTCYELLCGDPLAVEDVLGYALEFESHPDNLAAALYGGLVSAAVGRSSVPVVRLPFAAGARPVVVIPEFELSTERARAVLPDRYSRQDAVFNIQRSALTVAALTTGRWDVVREAMRDRIHQPYRSPLIPGLDEIMDLDRPGMLGVALSGAGPTVLAFAKDGQDEAVGLEIAGIFAKHGVMASHRVLDVDVEGRRIDTGR